MEPSEFELEGRRKLRFSASLVLNVTISDSLLKYIRRIYFVKHFSTFHALHDRTSFFFFFFFRLGVRIAQQHTLDLDEHKKHKKQERENSRRNIN